MTETVFTQDMTENSIPTPTIRKVIVEYQAPGWLVMDPEGTVTAEATALKVLAGVKYQDAKAGGFQVTVLEWRNVPEGFVPPEVKS